MFQTQRNLARAAFAAAGEHSGFVPNLPVRRLPAGPAITQEEWQREAVMARGVCTGLLLVAAMLGVALWSRSLTLTADALRACPLTLLELFAYIVLRRIHRHQLDRYQFGFGKIESLLNLLMAGVLILSSTWIFALGIYRLEYPPPPHPLGLVGAVLIASLNTVQNVWMLANLLHAGRGGGSTLIEGQVQTRLLKLISSAVAAIAILASAALGGHFAGLLVDVAGSALVVQVMLWTACRMIGRVLPDLLDKAIDVQEEEAIETVLDGYRDLFAAILHVRTRRSGSVRFVEIAVEFCGRSRMHDVQFVSQSVRREIEALVPHARITFVATGELGEAP